MSVATVSHDGPGTRPARAGTRARRVASWHVLWWGLFAAGGMVAAVLLPVHVLFQGILGPLGVVPVVNRADGTLASALASPLVRLYLGVLLTLPWFHAAHRLRYLLLDLGVHGGRMAIAVACYGAATVASVVAIWVLATA